jgi:hypothetical protein
MDKRIAALEDKLTDRLVEVLVKARFEEETAQMLQVLDGNVPESTLRQGSGDHRALHAGAFWRLGGG